MMTSISDPAALKTALFDRAMAAGFADAGIADLTQIVDLPSRLQHFLSEGRHGDMGWMENRAHWRQDPRTLWPDVRSVVMLTTNYGPEHDPLGLLGATDRGLVSAYAIRRDYHDVVKKRLKQLARWLVGETGCQLKVFVDTAPVMEKPLAAAAGLGWQGKHTNLVTRNTGSWTFLGAIFTDIDLPADETGADSCGRCQACIDICPTNAIIAPYQLDARRCIAYLTVEHQGQIPVEYRAEIGNRIFGCDDCLAICPWNKFAQRCDDEKLASRGELLAGDLADLLMLDETDFRSRFAQTPVKRLGHARFLRNVLVAAGNCGDRQLTTLVETRLTHSSALVRGMAVWALARIAEPAVLKALADQHMAAERDETVLREWRDVLGNVP